MQFRISDTFTTSLAKLNGNEQKAVKTTAFDLQLNPNTPGMKFHRIENAKDSHFWSLRVNLDIRLIVHKSASSLLLCYVDHHDKAYQWARCRRLETHPKTGAAQMVEIRETVKELITKTYVEPKESSSSKPRLFAGTLEEELLNYGVPVEWMNDVRRANEETLLELADHLPSEAAEALLDIATGVIPKVALLIDKTDPFKHPDAQRRFRVMNNLEELELALDYPWEKWTVFLHPEQSQLVERDYNGPARISGSAGTGKTIVALHRAVWLAKNNPDARILLTTFSETLGNALKTKLRMLISNQPRLGERLEVHALDAIGEHLYELTFGRPVIASQQEIKRFINQAASDIKDHKFSLNFLMTEWEEVVDAWQLETWEAYRDVMRLGRKTRIPEKQRIILWGIFEHVKSELKALKVITSAQMFSQISTHLAERNHPPFEFVVIDEAQDINIPQLRFLSVLGAGRPNSLFFAGDLGQRIFQQPFSWKSLGIDIRGRSRTLRINYRTSHQIRMQADRLLASELSDVDGNTEKRQGTISVFNGPEPDVWTLDSSEDEIKEIGKWLIERINEGVMPHETGIFVRSENELNRASKAVEKAGLSFQILDKSMDTIIGHVSISTMNLAKGLEFKTVVVMACDDEVIPSQERIETVTDDSDLEEVYNTERHLLYVACTRARDHLLVTSVDPASEFIDDLIL